jgi:hypothetical protein
MPWNSISSKCMACIYVSGPFRPKKWYPPTLSRKSPIKSLLLLQQQHVQRNKARNYKWEMDIFGK